MAYIGEVPQPPYDVNITASDSFSIDAFGRWRVSNPVTLFDSKNIFDDDGLSSNVENLPLFYDNAETSGGSTSTSYRANEASQRLTVAATTAGSRVRQSKQRFNYQPGKSQLIFTTFNFITLDADVTKKVGYFDEKNGLFLEADGTTISLVRRTYTSGSAVDNKVVKSSWNIDAFDGNGPSGLTLDLTKTQILFFDFEWLGVGRVRMGFVIDGKIYYAHEFLNANNLTIVYMTSPNLPIRWEIENGGSGVESNLDCICASVQSEGGQSELGVIRYAATNSVVSANSAGTIYAVVGIKLKSEYIGTTIKIIGTSLIETTGSSNLEWSLKLNPTVTGTFTYSDETNSAVQIARGNTATVTGGTNIGGGFFNSGQGNSGGSISGQIPSALTLGSLIDGTLDEIVLCVKPLTGSSNTDVWGALNWREII